MKNNKYSDIIKFIRELYNTDLVIPLHEPQFKGNEKKYLNECIDSTFVSSAGKFVDVLEKKIANYTGAKYAIATSNATSALHIACLALGIKKRDLVWTVPNTFVASANCAINCGAKIDFVDINKDIQNKIHQKFQILK